MPSGAPSRGQTRTI
uniref:Gpm554 n=1 Tax=Arundo donax TaxID=35708 RepID=A0A0A8Z3E8_ARUDO